MTSLFSFQSALFLGLAAVSVASTGCSSTSPGEEEGTLADTAEALSTTRVFGVVAQAFAADDHDGLPGEECVVLVAPEHRLRKVLLVEPLSAAGTCSLSNVSVGSFVSFVWNETSPYSSSAGRAALRGVVADPGAAVHTLDTPLTSEASASAELDALLALSPAAQALAIEDAATTITRRVHSVYDFEGAAEVSAEAAYHGVAVSGPCEQPGSPELTARVKGGFVIGYVAANQGSCHSGWFSMTHVYNRLWQRVATREYSE